MKIRRKLLWFLLIYIVVIFISQFPLYYASFTTPDGFFFTGQASWFDPWDINVYVSTIKYGQHHGFLLENLYSTEIGGKALYYPMYTLIGMIFPHIDPFTLFQLLNIIVPFFIIYFIYKLSSHVIAKYHLKRQNPYVYLIMLSTALGRGIGWMMPPSVRSADLYITSFSMRSSFQRPHEGVGTFLYFISMLSFYLYLRNSSRKYMYMSFVASLLLILFYPYYLLMFFVVNAIQILIVPYKDKLWKLMCLLLHTLIIGILTYLYYLHLSHSNFVAAIGEVQPKLSLLQIVSGYGAYLIVFLISLFSFNRKDESKTYMILWIVVGVICSYLPFGFARFFLRGLFYPLSILLTVTLIQIRSSIRFKKVSIIFMVIFILLTFPSAVFIFSSRIRETGRNNPWYYLPEEYNYSYGFISTLPKDGILSTYMMGNVIPAYTGKRVYIGHTLQTPDFNAREKLVNHFYRGEMSSQEAIQFLKNNNINYVYYSHFENLVGTKFADYKFLTPIYKNKGAVVFEVDTEYRM